MTRRRSIRPARTARATRIGQQPKTVRPASFGMELDADQGSAGGCRDKWMSMGGAREDQRLDAPGRFVAVVGRRPYIRVHEVEVGAVLNSVENRVRSGALDLVPADVRQRWRVDQR